jgi:hypothetical protein
MASGISALIAAVQLQSQATNGSGSSQPVANDPLVLIGQSLDALHQEVDALSRKVDALCQLLARARQRI